VVCKPPPLLTPLNRWSIPYSHDYSRLWFGYLKPDYRNLQRRRYYNRTFTTIYLRGEWRSRILR